MSEQGHGQATIDSLREAALKGSTEAKLGLAKRLLSYEPYDISAGYKWARAAAEDGNGEAEHLLAVATAEGLGARQNWQGALDHLQRSAELGHAPARAELAALAGDWTPPDAADWSASSRNWTILRRRWMWSPGCGCLWCSRFQALRASPLSSGSRRPKPAAG